MGAGDHRHWFEAVMAGQNVFEPGIFVHRCSFVSSLVFDESRLAYWSKLHRHAWGRAWSSQADGNATGHN